MDETGATLAEVCVCVCVWVGVCAGESVRFEMFCACWFLNREEDTPRGWKEDFFDSIIGFLISDVSHVAYYKQRRTEERKTR